MDHKPHASTDSHPEKHLANQQQTIDALGNENSPFSDEMWSILPPQEHNPFSMLSSAQSSDKHSKSNIFPQIQDQQDFSSELNPQSTAHNLNNSANIPISEHTTNEDEHRAEIWYKQMNLTKPTVSFPTLPQYSLSTAFKSLSVLAPSSLYHALTTHAHRWLLLCIVTIIILSFLHAIALLFLSTSSSVNDSVQAILCAMTWICVLVTYIPIYTPPVDSISHQSGSDSASLHHASAIDSLRSTPSLHNTPSEHLTLAIQGHLQSADPSTFNPMSEYEGSASENDDDDDDDRDEGFLDIGASNIPLLHTSSPSSSSSLSSSSSNTTQDSTHLLRRRSPQSQNKNKKREYHPTLERHLLWQSDRKIVVFLFFCLTFLLFVFIISAVEYLHTFTHTHTSSPSSESSSSLSEAGRALEKQYYSDSNPHGNTAYSRYPIESYVSLDQYLYSNDLSSSIDPMVARNISHMEQQRREAFAQLRDELNANNNGNENSHNALDTMFVSFFTRLNDTYGIYDQSFELIPHHHHDNHQVLPTASDSDIHHHPHHQLIPSPITIGLDNGTMMTVLPDIIPHSDHHHHHLLPHDTNDVLISIFITILSILMCYVHLVVFLRLLPFASYLNNPYASGALSKLSARLLQWQSEQQIAQLSQSSSSSSPTSSPSTSSSHLPSSRSLFTENVIEFFQVNPSHGFTTCSLHHAALLSGVFFITAFTFLRSISVLITQSILLLWTYFFTFYTPHALVPEASSSSLSLFSKPLIISIDVLIKCYMFYILLIPLQSLVYILMRSTPKPLIIPFARVIEILYAVHHDSLHNDNIRKRLCSKYLDTIDEIRPITSLATDESDEVVGGATSRQTLGNSSPQNLMLTDTLNHGIYSFDPIYSIHSISHAHCWQASLHFTLASIAINLEPSAYVNIYNQHGAIVTSLPFSTIQQSSNFHYYHVMSQYKIYCYAKQLLSDITPDNSVQLIMTPSRCPS